MIGLPGEDWKSMRYTARQGVRLKPDFIRIYPVLVLEGTVLGQMYRAGTYRPIRLEEAVCKAAFMKRWYNHHGIGVIRVGLQATDELDTGHSLLAGPYHPAMGEMLHTVHRPSCYYAMDTSCSRTGRNRMFPQGPFKSYGAAQGVLDFL